MKTKSIACRDCGKSFTAYPTAKYCPECRSARAAAYNAKNRRFGPDRKLGSLDNCTVCGAEYTVANGNQKYCPGCKVTAYRKVDAKQSLEYYRRNKDTINPARYEKRHRTQAYCVWCVRPFDRVGSSAAQFCSPDCRRLHYNWRHREYMANKKRRKKIMDKTIYALGYVYGLAARALPEIIGTPAKVSYAPQNPVAGMAQAIMALHQNRKMTKPLDARIAEVLDGVDIDNLPESVPIIQQGAWQKGYYDAASDHALLPPPVGMAEARKRAGLTQEQAANAIGVGRDRVSRWETGSATPRKGTLEKLADLYQCEVDDLMG